MTFPAPRRNELQVKQIITEELVKQHSDLLDRPLGTLPGQVHLEVHRSITPVITPTRRVPIALKDDLSKELNRYVKKVILAPVEEPTPWLSSLAVATKTSGALRVCIDLRPLDEVLKRETYQIPILGEILPELSQRKCFPQLTCVQITGTVFLTTSASSYRSSQRRLEGTVGAGFPLVCQSRQKFSRTEFIKHWKA